MIYIVVASSSQTLAVILLCALPLFLEKISTNGRLNRRGYMLLGVGAIVYLVATLWILELDRAEKAQDAQRIEKLQRTIEGLRDRIFLPAADRVMTTPKGPSIPVIPTAGDPIAITSPQDGSEVVDERHLIEGVVSDPKSEVWVVVHPLDTSAYWVQPRITVGPGGVWRCLVYFGRSGDIDAGKKFEVVAIADPRKPLQEGDYDSTWPQAKWTSKPVEVTRR